MSKPETDLSVRDVFRIYTRDRDEAGRLLEVPQISQAWKNWARDFLEKTSGRNDAGPGCCESDG